MMNAPRHFSTRCLLPSWSETKRRTFDFVAGRCVRPRKAANIRSRSMTSCIEAQEPAESAVHPVEQARGNGSGKGVEIFFVYGRDLGGVGNRVSRQAGCTPG